MATRTYDYAKSMLKAKYYAEYLHLYNQLIAGIELEHLSNRERNRICMKHKSRAVSLLVLKYRSEYKKLIIEAYRLGLPNR
jgi:hypothetical protein